MEKQPKAHLWEKCIYPVYIDFVTSTYAGTEQVAYISDM